MFLSQVLSVIGRTKAFFGPVQEHGKSPCFPRLDLLRVSDVGCLCLDVGVLDMRFCLKCA